jgi:hypothetical protein
MCLVVCANSQSSATFLSIVMLAVCLTTSATAATVSGSGLPPDVLSVFDLDPDVAMASSTTEPAFQRMVTDPATGKVMEYAVGLLLSYKVLNSNYLSRIWSGMYHRSTAGACSDCM